MPDDAPPSRKEKRNAVAIRARCRTLNGIRGEGAIHDISANGCSVTLPSLRLKVGSRVIVKPEGLEAIAGIVRWTSKGRAGIEFNRPLYEPVLDDLSRRHRPAGTVTITS